MLRYLLLLLAIVSAMATPFMYTRHEAIVPLHRVAQLLVPIHKSIDHKQALKQLALIKSRKP